MGKPDLEIDILVVQCVHYHVLKRWIGGFVYYFVGKQVIVFSSHICLLLKYFLRRFFLFSVNLREYSTGIKMLLVFSRIRNIGTVLRPYLINPYQHSKKYPTGKVTAYNITRPVNSKIHPGYALEKY